MNINLGKYMLSVTLSPSFWEQRVVQEVDKMLKTPLYSGTGTKIQRIKALRTLASMFPEEIREYSSVSWDNTTPLLGLGFCKEWVEAHWTENGYGDSVL
jgi:hypothetical protein